MFVHNPQDDQPNPNKCAACESEVLAKHRKPNPHTDSTLGNPRSQIVENDGGELFCWCEHTVHMPGCTAYIDGECICVGFFEQTGSVVVKDTWNAHA